MPLINASRVINNLLVLAILFGIGLLIYSKLDKNQIRHIINSIGGLFERKGGK